MDCVGAFSLAWNWVSGEIASSRNASDHQTSPLFGHYLGSGLPRLAAGYAVGTKNLLDCGSLGLLGAQPLYRFGTAHRRSPREPILLPRAFRQRTLLLLLERVICSSCVRLREQRPDHAVRQLHMGRPAPRIHDSDLSEAFPGAALSIARCICRRNCNACDHGIGFDSAS